MSTQDLGIITCVSVYCSDGQKSEKLKVNVEIQDGYFLSEIKSPSNNGFDLFIEISKDPSKNKYSSSSSHKGYKKYQEQVDIEYGNGFKTIYICHNYKHHDDLEHENLSEYRKKIDEGLTHRNGGVIIDPRT